MLGPDSVREAFNKAYQDRNEAAIADLCAVDVQFIPPGKEIIRGPYMIAKHYAEEFQTSDYKFLLCSGEVLDGISLATIKGRFIKEDTHRSFEGNYLLVLFKFSDGWKILYDIWNIDNDAPFA